MKWLKEEFTKTLIRRVNLSLLTILMISSVTSTVLQISRMGEYIGRKYFWKFRTPKGKKRKVKSESDWKKYYGSCPELKEEIKQFGRQNFSRTILSLHYTKGKTNYEETRQLFANKVLTERLTMEHQNTIIATSSQGISEKTIMEMKTTEEAFVADARAWSLTRMDSEDISDLDAESIYSEFQEWIEPLPELDILSLDNFRILL